MSVEGAKQETCVVDTKQDLEKHTTVTHEILQSYKETSGVAHRLCNVTWPCTRYQNKLTADALLML